MSKAIQNHPIQPQPSTWEVCKKNLSEIDWKTHSLVVLSYMLIGFGIALAISSFYIAFVAHPMIAMGSPALPIIGGIFLLRIHDQQEQAKLLPAGSVSAEIAPKGIVNIRYNCWIISALQMLFHIQAFKKLLNEASPEEKKELGPLLAAYKDYQEGIPVDAQKIREWLSEQPERNICPDPEDPEGTEDANFALNLILKQFKRENFPNTKLENIFYPVDKICEPLVSSDQNYDLRYQTILTPFHFKYDTTLSVCHNELKNQEFGFDEKGELVLNVYELDKKGACEHKKQVINPHQDMQKALNALFNCRLNGIEKYNKIGTLETKISLKSPPEDLSFDISGNYGKNQTLQKFYNGMIVQLDASQAGENTMYACDGFIVRLPASRNIGHYVSYFLDNGVWWYANDNTVKKVTYEEAVKAQEDATFVHYAKVASF